MIKLFATCPKGVEDLLADELTAAGGSSVRQTRAGVSFEGTLETAMSVCLWSRTANRILMPLATLEASGTDDLYEQVRAIAWEDHLAPDGTLAVDANVTSTVFPHSRYASLKTKDAVVDRFRDRFGRRPSVDTGRPDLRINVHIIEKDVSVSIDLSGSSLHQRGYRTEKGEAPLKENLAAAILLRAGWPAAARGEQFMDIMCGSGTLPIEAALMAADVAPGLSRDYFGFSGWLGFEKQVWTALQVEARYRAEEGLEKLTAISGSDSDGRVLNMARANAGRAGLSGKIALSRIDMKDVKPRDDITGLMVVNPPYGERLGDIAELRDLYSSLGRTLRENFKGWRAAVFTGNPELGKEMGMRAVKTNALYNGPIKCKLLQFDVSEKYFYRELKQSEAQSAKREVDFSTRNPEPGTRNFSGNSAMFANRLRKNLKTLGKWAAREKIECYRLYDADIPEYNLTVELYGEHVHVAEYQAPYGVAVETAQKHLAEAMAVIKDVLEVSDDRVHLKLRRRQKGMYQYGRQGETRRFLQVGEDKHRFLVNLDDYLDTGLFLDHRRTRQLIAREAEGLSFLNLFAYTGTATVYAAAGGASATTTVDLSNTYLDWARRNLELNGLDGSRHRFIKADCLRWMREEEGRYGLIFLDPPTYSKSKAMDGDMDVQRDHAGLVRMAAGLLDKDGLLIFSTNRRDFVLDTESLGDMVIKEITASTLPKDFPRKPPAHRCFRIEKKVRHCG
jgi:23S rRNA (guanine2445-N2)-methyltransferase / 23S rRNA (guanine2069-N7)-methyltransferase